ncbi:MAG: hypothetical protein H0T09_04035 [Actinobacteria bacterium]|nr:hypothetical protein [Actinomycetota bacterium]
MTRLGELACTREVASDHGADPEPVQEHGSSVLVGEFLDEREALLPQALGSGGIAGDVRGATAGPQRVRTGRRRRNFGGLVFEQARNQRTPSPGSFATQNCSSAIASSSPSPSPSSISPLFSAHAKALRKLSCSSKATSRC